MVRLEIDLFLMRYIQIELHSSEPTGKDQGALTITVQRLWQGVMWLTQTQAQKGLSLSLSNRKLIPTVDDV